MMMVKPWGDNFNLATDKWPTKNADADGKPLERAFNISDYPIFKIFAAVMNGKKEDVFIMTKKLDVRFLQGEKDLEDRRSRRSSCASSSLPATPSSK